MFYVPIAPKNKITNSIPDQKDNLSDGIASSLEDGEITDDEDNDKNVQVRGICSKYSCTS